MKNRSLSKAGFHRGYIGAWFVTAVFAITALASCGAQVSTGAKTSAVNAQINFPDGALARMAGRQSLPATVQFSFVSTAVEILDPVHPTYHPFSDRAASVSVTYMSVEPTAPATMYVAVLDDNGAELYSGSADFDLNDGADVYVSVNLAVPTVSADAGGHYQTEALVPVGLDGSNSQQVYGDPLGYSWRIVGAPAGSNPKLSGANGAYPTFEADLEGYYDLLLTVSDSSGNRDIDYATVAVTGSILPPPPPLP